MAYQGQIINNTSENIKGIRSMRYWKPYIRKTIQHKQHTYHLSYLNVNDYQSDTEYPDYIPLWVEQEVEHIDERFDNEPQKRLATVWQYNAPSDDKITPILPPLEVLDFDKETKEVLSKLLEYYYKKQYEVTECQY